MACDRSDIEIEILRLLRLRKEQRDPRYAEPSELAEVTGKPVQQVSRACTALEVEGCIIGVHALAGEPGYHITDVGEASLYDHER